MKRTNPRARAIAIPAQDWPARQVTVPWTLMAGFLFLALAFEVFVRRVNDVATFVVDGLAILAGAFIGPALVQLVGYLSRTEYGGLALGLMTWVSCTVVTVVLALTFRCFY